MAGGNIPGYVARYGDALRKLTGGQPSMGALGTVTAGQVQDPSLGGGMAGLASLHAGGIDNAAGTPAMGALPQPAAPTSPVQGALPGPPAAAAPAAPQPVTAPLTPAAPGAKAAAAPEGEGGKSFWDIAKDLTDPEKDKITKNFEDQGVNVEHQYQQLIDSGQADPAMIKRGKDGKIDRRDMGLFLLEFGLKTMQSASQPGQSGLGAVASGALGTIEGRRGRAADQAALAKDERRYQETRQDKKDERADRAAERADKRNDSVTDRKLQVALAMGREGSEERRAKDERATRERMAKDENLSRERVAKMQRGADRGTYVDEEDGKVYWLESGEPVMVKDAKGAQKQLEGKRGTAKAEITERDLLKAVTDKESSLDESMMSTVTIPGESTPIRWSKASQTQREKYLEKYGQTLRARHGKQTPGGTANSFDQFD